MAFAPNNAVAVVLLLALVAVASAVVPSFTANPTSVVVNDHQAVSFSVTVAGTAPLTIQWQENNGKDTLWADISGATTSTLDISSSLVSRLSNQGWRYRAVATNLEGQAISTEASVTINIPPEIVAQNTTVTGSNNGFVSLFSLATGTPSPSVQWQVSTDRGVTYSPIAGANAPIYTFRVTNANNGNFYRAVYSNPAGTDTSDDILLIVPLYTAASVFVHPLSQTIVLGTDVTFSVDFSGGELPTVQWQIFTTLANRWLNIDGATAASYTRVAVSDADRNARFRAVVTNRLGVSISNEALLTIPLLTPPAIIVQPSFAGRTTWGTLVTLRTRASGSPVPTARWERTLPMSSVFFPIGTDGSTQPDLSFIAQPNDTLSSFRVVYTNSQGSVTSTAYLLTLLVPSAPLFDVQPVPLTVQENEFARFTVVVSGSPLPNLQWQVSTDLGFTYTNITNQFSDSLIVQATNAVNHKLFYRVLANNTQGFAFSNPAYLTVVRPDAPLIRRHPASQEVPVGQPVVFDVEASALPAPTYQWESSQDGVNFAPLAGATFVSLRFPAVAATQQNTYYRVRVTNLAGAATSNPALLTVFSLNAPVVTVQPKSKNIPINTAVSLFSTAAGIPAPTVQWFSRASAAEPFTPIAGATATTYHFAATEFRQYRAVFSNANGSANSTIATVNVYGRLYRVTRSSSSSSSSSAASSIGLHAAVAAAVVALLALLSL